MSKRTVRRIEEPDLDVVVDVHMAAFPDSLVCRLGREAVVRQYRWLLYGPHTDAFGLVAEVDGEAAGTYLGGVYNGATTGYIQANLGFLAGSMARRPSLLFSEDYRAKARTGLRLLKRQIRTPRRLAPASTVVASEQATSAPAVPSGDGTIFGHLVLGVHPRFQRRGIARSLMEEADHIVDRLGYRKTQLRVVPNNEAIIKLHESRGYVRQVTGERAWDGMMVRTPLDPDAEHP